MDLVVGRIPTRWQCVPRQVRMNGRNVFMGYLNMKDKTLEAFDDDLWVRSGDIGKKDDGGFLFITGRIKGTRLIIKSRRHLWKMLWDLPRQNS